MSKTILLTGSWLASLALVFYAGSRWGESASPVKKTSEERQNSSRAAAAAASRDDNVAARNPSATLLDDVLAATPRSAPEKDAFKAAVLEALRGNGTRSERLARLAKVIAAMNRDNARLIREAFGVGWDEGDHFQAEHDQMWMRYGEVLGADAANEFAKPEGPFYPVYARMVEAWAMADPRAAGQWVAQLEGGSNSRAIEAAVVRGMAATDSGAALDLAFKIAGQYQSDPFTNEPYHALLAAESGAGNLGGAAGAQRFRDALAALPLERFNQVFSGVSRNNPDLAVKWADAFSKVHPEMSQAAYNSVADSWAQRDTTSLSEWLNKHPDQPGSDAMTLRMIRVIAKEDPAAARAWSARIKDPVLQHEAEQLTRSTR